MQGSDVCMVHTAKELKLWQRGLQRQCFVVTRGIVVVLLGMNYEGLEERLLRLVCALESSDGVLRIDG